MFARYCRQGNQCRLGKPTWEIDDAYPYTFLCFGLGVIRRKRPKLMGADQYQQQQARI
jgi:hypothetical protein